MAEVGDSDTAGKEMDSTDEESEQNAGNEDLFEVEKIIGRSKVKGNVLYKVRWKGYGQEDDTWEPKENLDSCQDLIEEYDQRQNEIAKKRNDERKRRQAIMEGRIESSDSSSDSNSPYPANFKNAFWKELEAGRVNVFDNDMYSKVKKRAATLHSQNKEQLSTDSNKDDTQSDKKQQAHSDPVSNSNSKKSKSKKAKSAPRKSEKWDSSCCIGYGTVTTDSDTDDDLFRHKKTVEGPKSNDYKATECSDNTDEELLKPSISLVIKKVPEISHNPRNGCFQPADGSGSNYTVLPKHADSLDLPKEPSSSHRSSERKKKKHHKHHKHKSKKSSQQDQDSQDKKRKASSTSLKNFSTETVKIPRMDEDSHNTNVLAEHNILKDNIMTVLKTESNNNENRLDLDIADKSDSVNKNSALKVVAETSEIKVEENNNYNVNSPPYSQPSQCFRSHCSEKTDSSLDLAGISDNTKDVMKINENLSQSDKSISRQISETTLDSGIHSPASEKSEVLFRQGSDERLVSLLKDQDLGIELDDFDWDLFDTEVTLEPVSISNDEFAAAVMSGDYQTVKRALVGDVKYDLEHVDHENKTLLMWSVQQGHDEMSDLLIEHGADINAQMYNGMTSLMIACYCGEISTVNLLLELGAKVNLESKDKKTALIYAAKRGHNQILWLLLECGANFNTQCQAGMTALDYVRLQRNSDMESILTNHITRVMSEFNKQVSVTLNGTARVLSAMFKPQLFNLSDDDKFEIAFQHKLQPPNSGLGYLLFIGNAMFANQEVKCRFYGPSAVRSVTLNGHPLSCLTTEGNFILAFSPLVDGRNLLTIDTINTKDSKTKLIVCACMTQLLQC